MASDLSAYLDRIGYDRPVRPDLATLRALHRAHLMAVPYENLDVQLGRALTTDPAAAFEKVTARRRGGWCYEMNGSFGHALKLAGFEVTRLAGEGDRPGSHLALIVAVEGETWVCDVGFGDGPAEPYPLVEGPFQIDGFEFRLEFVDGGGWRFHNHRFGAANGFVARAPDEAALAATCQFLQTDPSSTFVQHATVFRRVRDGYISLIDRTLRTATPQAVTPETITDADAYVATLRDRFGLDVPEAADLWPALCARHEAYERDRAARRAAKAAEPAG
ncbi:MAG TPA: arylamine N-acetyltransferase [Caulobacteraceae bacterium]|nr:arylamine N-acetyltransferase [Caulobacteraceae bacterium]